MSGKGPRWVGLRGLSGLLLSPLRTRKRLGSGGDGGSAAFVVPRGTEKGCRYFFLTSNQRWVKGGSMKTQQSINFDTDVLKELREMAKKRGCSVSRLVNDILRMGLDSRNEMLKELETVNLIELMRGLKRVVRDHSGK